MTTTRADLKLRTGGLMRCCVASFEKWQAADPKAAAQPGDKIPCVYENEDTMQVSERGDVVQWIGPQPSLYAVGKR